MEGIFNELGHKMKKAAEHLDLEFSKVRTGRANPQILDHVMVDYYGTPTALNQVGNLSLPDPQMIVITPWDKKMLSEIEKAILRYDLGLTPQNDGNIIRLPIPSLTEDRRKDLVKQVKKMVEEAKIAVRNLRRDGNERLKKMEKDKEIGQDELKTGEARIQKVTDEAIAKIEQKLAAKEKELMSI